MNRDVSLRIALDAIILVSAIFGLWYVAVPVGIVGAWVFPRYVELLIAGFAYDALFDMGRGAGISAYALTIASAIMLGAVAYLKAIVKNNT